MKQILLLTVITLLFVCQNSFSTVIKVPDDYPTIQSAINAAIDGDTVLVAPNRYYENINFNGRNIHLTSHYIFDKDVNFITSTIIDGSQPVHPDSASCVLIISGEDMSAVLEGFTLTGGTGTRWIDEHGAGTYFEGGGILTALSSPTIMNNLIISNEAIRVAPGVTSAGGGGIRCGDGNPRILNNVIMSNSGMYGGGIVLNYTGAIVRNNIIYSNRVYQAVAGAPTYGGGGIWINNNLGSTPKIIENNTIIDNSAFGGSSIGGSGGGILVWSTSIDARNNIVWGNTQNYGNQIALFGSGTANITYSDVEGGWPGTGNIDEYPLFVFEFTGFYLFDNSLCIDAGDPDAQYNDPEGDPGMGLWPAKGTVRNDMGAYGGPNSSELSPFDITSSGEETNDNSIADFRLDQNFPNPFNPTTKIRFQITEPGFVSLNVFDVLGNNVATLVEEDKPAGNHEVEFNANTSAFGSQNIASGIYYYRLAADNYTETRKMILLK
jgi:hypothetical protein